MNENKSWETLILPVISPSNAKDVTQIARWGQGTFNQVSWSADGKTLAIAGSDANRVLRQITSPGILPIFYRYPVSENATFSGDKDLFQSGNFYGRAKIAYKTLGFFFTAGGVTNRRPKKSALFRN